MAKVIQPFDPKDVVAHPEAYFRRAYVWQVPVRLTHWVSALCVTVLFLTGCTSLRPSSLPAVSPRTTSSWAASVRSTLPRA